jgi:hypothetical protein
MTLPARTMNTRSLVHAWRRNCGAGARDRGGSSMDEIPRLPLNRECFRKSP